MVRFQPLARLLAPLAAILVAVALATPLRADGRQDLVDKARITVEKMTTDPELPTLRKLLRKAKAVVVVPQYLKAGLIIGGAGGGAVLMARRGRREWSYPAFYDMGAGSIGFQAGAQASEIIMVVMTDSGLNALLEDKVKLGADASIAVITKGAGVEASTTTNLQRDIYAFSVTKGLYGGVTVEGALLIADDDWNAAYYGKQVTAREILFGGDAANKGADRLRRALNAR